MEPRDLLQQPLASPSVREMSLIEFLEGFKNGKSSRSVRFRRPNEGAMIENKQKKPSMLWKSIAILIIMFGLVKLLHYWVSEAVAWAVAGFTSILFAQLVPPRSSASVGIGVLIALGGDILLFAMTKLFG